jgi:hypothetical protein
MNVFASLEFRVNIGINPKERVKNVDAFFPSDTLLEDVDNLDNTTLLLRIKGRVVSEGLLAYLRENIQNNYDGPDKGYIMIASPRVMDFELIVIEQAIEILMAYPDSSQGTIFRETSLAQDQEALKTSTDDELSTILNYNI